MGIPSRDEAVQIARMNNEQDAARYMRKIEVSLMIWDGVSEIVITVPKDDEYLIPTILNELLSHGFTARTIGITGTATGRRVCFK